MISFDHLKSYVGVERLAHGDRDVVASNEPSGGRLRGRPRDPQGRRRGGCASQIARRTSNYGISMNNVKIYAGLVY